VRDLVIENQKNQKEFEETSFCTGCSVSTFSLIRFASHYVEGHAGYLAPAAGCSRTPLRPLQDGTTQESASMADESRHAFLSKTGMRAGSGQEIVSYPIIKWPKRNTRNKYLIFARWLFKHTDADIFEEQDDADSL